jgi:uncharacterized RDD family membrane protein YckC
MNGLAPEVVGSPYPKASLLLRAGARLLDLAIANAFLLLGLRPGCVVALIYMLLADGLLGGQSIGKRLCGVKVMHLPTRSVARTRDSVLRNAPFGLMFLLGLMPELGGRALLVGALVILSVESWRCWRSPLGLRIGDVLAETQVVDGKVVAGAQVAARHTTAAPDPGRVMRAARVTQEVEKRRDIRCASL